MTIKSKLLTLSAVLIAPAVFSGVVFQLHAEREERATQRTAAVVELEREIVELTLAMHQLNRKQSVVGDAPWKQQFPRIQAAVAKLAVIADQHETLPAVDRLTAISEQLAVLFKEWGSPTVHSDAAALVRSEWRQRLLGQLLVAAHRMISDSTRLRQHWEEELLQHARAARSQVFAVTLTGGLVVFVALFFLYHDITKPLCQLANAARQMGSGNLDVVVSERGQDEIGQVCHAFNHMVRELRQLHRHLTDLVAQRTAELEAANQSLAEVNDSLEQRVTERTEELSQANSELTREIAQRRCVEAALREHDQMLGTITETSQDGIILMDVEGSVAYWNTAAERIFGYAAAEVMGQNLHLLLAPERLHDKWRRGFEAFRTTGKGPLIGTTLELSAVHRSGHEFPIELSVASVQQEGCWHAVGVARDITTRKQKEREQAQYAEELAEANVRLQQLQRQLMEAARETGMAEVASDVLHNVGNILNSVNVSSGILFERLHSLGVADLQRAIRIVQEHSGDLASYLTQDEHGQHFLDLLIALAEHMTSQEEALLREVQSLADDIDHIKQLVAVQQDYAGRSGLTERFSVANLLEDAIRINCASAEGHQIEIIRDYAELQDVIADRHKALLIVANLISNAKNALIESTNSDKRIVVRLAQPEDNTIRIEISDNGIGIASEVLSRIFAQGFTTRKDGHGYGLHSAAVAASQLNGTLSATSDGLGQGATFALQFPVRVPTADTT